MKLIELKKDLHRHILPIIDKALDEFMVNIKVTTELEKCELELRIDNICITELMREIEEIMFFCEIEAAIHKWRAYGLDVQKHGVQIMTGLFDKIGNSYKKVAYVVVPLLDAGLTEEMVIEASKGYSGELECRFLEEIKSMMQTRGLWDVDNN